MGNENYMKNIQVSAYVGIALDAIVEFFCFIIFGKEVCDTCID